MYRRQAQGGYLAGARQRIETFATRLENGVVAAGDGAVSYTNLRAHQTGLDLVCRLLLEKKKNTTKTTYI